MIRGTTAGFTFTLPYSLNKLSSATVTFWQEGYKGTEEYPLPIIKSFKDFSEFDDSKQLTVTLTAADTKRFTDKLKARVQLVARTREVVDDQDNVIEPSVRFASRISLITVHPMKDDIIEDNPEDIVPSDQDGYIILDGHVVGV